MARIDKKIDCPIVLSQTHFTLLAGLAELWELSHPEATRDVAVRAAESDEVALRLAPYYRKGLCLGNKAYIGHQKVENYRREFGDLSTGKRVHVKLSYDDWLLISPYQNAIDCPRSHAVALLVIGGLSIVSRETFEKGVIVNGIVWL